MDAQYMCTLFAERSGLKIHSFFSPSSFLVCNICSKIVSIIFYLDLGLSSLHTYLWALAHSAWSLCNQSRLTGATRSPTREQIFRSYCLRHNCFQRGINVRASKILSTTATVINSSWTRVCHRLVFYTRAGQAIVGRTYCGGPPKYSSIIFYLSTGTK